MNKSYAEMAKKIAEKIELNLNGNGTADGLVSLITKALESLAKERDEEIKLLQEQNESYHKSANFCASCGLLLPFHTEECGRFPKVVKHLQKTIDTLRFRLARMRDLVLDDVPHQYQKRLLEEL